MRRHTVRLWRACRPGRRDLVALAAGCLAGLVLLGMLAS
jgi:hypothetical protein